MMDVFAFMSGVSKIYTLIDWCAALPSNPSLKIRSHSFLGLREMYGHFDCQRDKTTDDLGGL